MKNAARIRKPWGRAGLVLIATALAATTASVAAEGTAGAQEGRIDALRGASRDAPGDWGAAVALARGLRVAGHSEQAETELRRAAVLAGAKPDALAAVDAELARVYEDRRDFARASAVCGRVLKLAGQGAAGHACLAGAYLLWQRASQALAESEQALALDPRSYDARLAEGRAYDLQLDWSRAEGSLREAIALRPDAADAHRVLGSVLSSAGRHEEAVAEMRKAVELDDENPDGLFELASELLGASSGSATAPGEAVRLLERASRERPSFTAADVALGAEYLRAGRPSDAKAAAETALRNDPANTDARVLLGKIALSEGHPDDAIRAGEAVLKSVANSAAAKLLVADGNAKKGELDVALEAYQAAWGLDHRDPTALVHASEACHAAGRDTTARAYAVRATQEFPEWAPGWAALGDALAAQRETDAARDAYGKALRAPNGSVDRERVRRRVAELR